MLVTYLFLGVVIGGVFGLLLGRFARPVGIVFLTLGLAPMAALYVYETFIYTSGDTSSLGMFATLALILFFPFGLVLTVVGIFRGE